MVTQVIGDSVARAFSLVGALSIVRFRTVVRDTRDTAFVVFSVVVGMAIGAQSYWAAGLGTAVVGAGAFILAGQGRAQGLADPQFLLTIRVALGHNLEGQSAQILDDGLLRRELVTVSTVRQGAALEFIYEVTLQPSSSAEDLVRSLNRVEGVQDVKLEMRGFEKN
jgi:uncharacterized membrane protein YhiD involved in acid resistance